MTADTSLALDAGPGAIPDRLFSQFAPKDVYRGDCDTATVCAKRAASRESVGESRPRGKTGKAKLRRWDNCP